MKPNAITTPETRAANVLAPYSDGTADSNVLGFVTGAFTAGQVIPEDWEGCFVTCLSIGQDTYWFFSNQSAVGPAAAAAADGGADPQQAWPLLNGQSMDCIVPRADAGQRIYFCADAAGAGEFWMRKTSTG